MRYIDDGDAAESVSDLVQESCVPASDRLEAYREVERLARASDSFAGSSAS